MSDDLDDAKFGMELLRGWLRCPTIQPPVYAEPQPDLIPAQIEVDFRETDAANLHFNYAGGVSACIKLKLDGTWEYTVGQ